MVRHSGFGIWSWRSWRSLELEILEELGVGDLGGAWSWRPWRSLELETLEELGVGDLGVKLGVGGVEDLGRAVETIEGALETTEDHW
jgi:hypothetical protein